MFIRFNKSKLQLLDTIKIIQICHDYFYFSELRVPLSSVEIVMELYYND